MKRIIRFLSLLLVLLLFAGTVTAYAAEWSEDYYRASDMSGELTETERNDLDTLCIDIMKAHQVDVTLLALRPDDYKDSSMKDMADTYYTSSRFGYGAGGDGFCVVCDTETGEAEVFAYGSAADKVPEDYLEYTADHIAGYKDQYGVYGMLYAGAKFLSNYMDEHPEGAAAGGAAETEEADLSSEIAQAEAGGAAAGTAGAAADAAGAAAEIPAESYTDMAGNVHVGAGTGKPDWYPAEPQNFTFYNDETAARVMDIAELFPEAEKQQMEQRLAEIRAEIGKDIVIYTDTTSYGLGHEACAEDFYDYNGYGIGEEREGCALFICMDPNDRGFWTACTGPETIGLFTEEYANQMDDALYNYLVNGQYAEGVRDWIENFYTLYTKGMPFPPEWYDANKTERTHDAAAPRIDDTIGLFTNDEVQKLTEQAKKISDKYGLDVVIHTAAGPAGISPDSYPQLYYEQKGYGFGDDYDGILLTIFRDFSGGERTRLYASGKGLDRLSDANRKRLMGFAEDDAASGKFYKSASGWLSNVEHMQKTGRVPHAMIYWIMTVLLGSGLGSIFGGISLGGAKAKMRVPKPQPNADRYLIPGSLQVGAVRDYLINTNTSKRYVPPAPKSSGRTGGSSGGSTFHGSHSGHSGTTHSGSGRKF